MIKSHLLDSVMTSDARNSAVCVLHINNESATSANYSSRDTSYIVTDGDEGPERIMTACIGLFKTIEVLSVHHAIIFHYRTCVTGVLGLQGLDISWSAIC